MKPDTKPVDAAKVLTELAAFWADPQPGHYGQRVPGRIAGSKHDQPVPRGISNPYWEIIRQMPLDTISAWYGHGRPEPDGYFLAPDGTRLIADRHTLCATFAWSIPSPGDIAWIRKALRGRGVVEAGAGGGYWAWQLAQSGVRVAAYEPADWRANHFVSRSPWVPVLRNDHTVTKKHPECALLLCWPSYNEPWAGKALSLYGGDQLFYAGEGEGGCCADDSFFNLLAAEWDEVADCPHHVSYSGIHCYLTEYRRKR